MIKTKKIGLYVLLVLLISACSMTKYVPEGSHLLNKVEIETDNKDISSSDMESYIQQTPNKSWTFLGRVSLRVYSLSGRDTSKWRNRTLRKMGEAPVIYSPYLMKATENQLAQRMQNLGYLNAKVTNEVKYKKKKAKIIYHIESGTQYTIRNLKVGITDTNVAPLLQNPHVESYYAVREGQPFESEFLDNISDRLTRFLRNQGYYNLAKENFYFLVDTAVGNHQVDVELMSRNLVNDSLKKNDAFIRYKIKDVTIISGLDIFDKSSLEDFKEKEEVNYRGINIIYGKKRFIRPPMLYANNFIRPGRYYSDRLQENTYSSLNSMSAVKQATIEYTPVKDSALLNATITIAPANIYYWQVGLDGTNSAGNLGMAAYTTFQDRNIFNGSETFRIKLNGAFESINGNSDYDIVSDIYYEYGGEASLTFPQFLMPFVPEQRRQQVGASTVFSTGLNWRNRPEYNRRFLSLDWKYKWMAFRRKLNQTFTLYNINYVATPWTSTWFSNYLKEKDNAMLKESYKDQFITRTSYMLNFTSKMGKRAQTEGFTIQASADVAGTLPYLYSKLSGAEKVDGSYELFGIPFAQYFKTSGDLTYLFPIDKFNIIASHIGVGIAVPYSNSEVVPYEQRFFAGGPNSVRGWSTRTLGPGTYESKGSSDFLNQTGDIKLLLNVEYRLKTESFLEYALFADAGNVWTIKNYENQPGGEFKLDTFFEEMGIAWGLGIRPNFGFILVRLDLGMKIFNPEITGSPKDRWVITHPDLGQDLAFHFAIGYPF